MGLLQSADYSYFLARYGVSQETAEPDMANHIKWAVETHGFRPLTGDDRGVDAGLLLTEQREFADSRDSLGLQLADILASVLRRALNDRLGVSGWKSFGRLLVRKRHPGSSFVQLGQGEDVPQTLRGHVAKVCRALDGQAKSMLLPDEVRRAQFPPPDNGKLPL